MWPVCILPLLPCVCSVVEGFTIYGAGNLAQTLTQHHQTWCSGKLFEEPCMQ